MSGPVLPSISSSAEKQPLSGSSLLLFFWAFGGVLFILLRALFRLSQYAWEPVAQGQLQTSHVLLCVLWCLLNAYLEGYRGFQKRFVPRVLARTHYLLQAPTLLRVLLAPLFVMGFFHAKTRALLSAWILSCGIASLVLIVRLLPQPWRGLIDAGVVVGLGWGTIALFLGGLSLLRGSSLPPADPEVPEEEEDSQFLPPPPPAALPSEPHIL